MERAQVCNWWRIDAHVFKFLLVTIPKSSLPSWASPLSYGNNTARCVGTASSNAETRQRASSEGLAGISRISRDLAGQREKMPLIFLVTAREYIPREHGTKTPWGHVLYGSPKRLLATAAASPGSLRSSFSILPAAMRPARHTPMSRTWRPWQLPACFCDTIRTHRNRHCADRCS